MGDVAGLLAQAAAYNVVDDSPEHARYVVGALAAELGAPQSRRLPVSKTKLAVEPAPALLTTRTSRPN